jgi:hypothetical protein
VDEWFIALGTGPKIITDGTSCVLEDMILTTVPYHCSKEQKSIWLDRGQTIRRQRGSQWLVLHLVPPNTNSISPVPSRKPAVAIATSLVISRPELQFMIVNESGF